MTADVAKRPRGSRVGTTLVVGSTVAFFAGFALALSRDSAAQIVGYVLTAGAVVVGGTGLVMLAVTAFRGDQPCAACWLPDPLGVHEYRFHDGRAWTAWVSDGGTVSIDNV